MKKTLKILILILLLAIAISIAVSLVSCKENHNNSEGNISTNQNGVITFPSDKMNLNSDDATIVSNDTYSKEEVVSKQETVSKEDSSKPASIHEHSYTKKVVKPTCTTEGYTKYTCECGKSYKDDETKKLGHDYTEWTTTKKATTTSEGVKTCTCERCGKTKNENIPKLEVPANVDSKIEVTKRFGTTRYAFKKSDVIDKRTWGEPPVITIDNNDVMHVTYYNKEGEKVQFTVEQPPVKDVVVRFNIFEDGTYNSQRIGSYS